MKKHLALLLLVFVFSCNDQQKSNTENLETRIQRIENGLMQTLQIEGETPVTYNINDRLREKGIPGISIAFAHNGKIEWARAYGMADSSQNRPMTTETMLLAGSISKPVAALRAHQMVEEGKLTLDGNVNDYLTSWKVPDNEFTVNEKVTLRRILNHTAGLTIWGFPGYDKGDEIPSVVDVLDGKGNTGEVRVYKEPGGTWQYSGGGYTIMQLMVTDVEGSSFPETMQVNVLDKMGMERSTFENPLPEEYHGIAATGYRNNGTEVEGKWPIYPEMAAAGLWTTPSQLIQYGIEIQKINNTQKDGIISYASTEEMLVPGDNGHGLGPGIGDNTFGHGGADEGFRARLLAWKDSPHAVVIMVNSDNGSIIQEVLLAIANEYGLSDITPDVRSVVEISEEELAKYTGNYQIPNMGIVEAKIVEGALTFSAPFINPSIQLAAESDTLFFDRAGGMRIDFTLEDGQVNEFKVQGLTATRIK